MTKNETEFRATLDVILHCAASADEEDRHNAKLGLTEFLDRWTWEGMMPKPGTRELPG